MKKTITFIISVVILGFNGRAEKVDFAKSIQGIFEARCIDCHGPKNKKGISDSTVKRQRWLRLLSLASQAKASSTNISLYLLTMRI